MSIIELCRRIGITNLGELLRFDKEERRSCENLQQALERYYNELGGENFKIMEEL